MPRTTKPRALAETGGEIRFRNPLLAAGFTMYPNPVLCADELSDGAIRLYGLILLHARQSDRAWPGQKRLAQLGAGHPRSQRRHLRELENAGLITTQQTGLNQPNTYWLEEIPARFMRDRPKMADPDRPKMADPDRPKMADKEYTDQEYTSNNINIASGGVAPDAGPAYDPAFETVWLTYPQRNGKRLGKAAAYRAWRNLNQTDRAALPGAITNYAASEVVRDLGAPKDMIRFLRDGFWRDWQTPETPRPATGNGNGKGHNPPADPNVHNFAKWRSMRGGNGTNG